MLSGINFANADDLDSFVKNRQQVLNQFEDAKQPAPAQAPQIMRKRRSIWQGAGQRLKSRLEKPVVVMMDPTVKKE